MCGSRESHKEVSGDRAGCGNSKGRSFCWGTMRARFSEARSLETARLLLAMAKSFTWAKPRNPARTRLQTGEGGCGVGGRRVPAYPVCPRRPELKLECNGILALSQHAAAPVGSSSLGAARFATAQRGGWTLGWRSEIRRWRRFRGWQTCVRLGPTIALLSDGREPLLSLGVVETSGVRGALTRGRRGELGRFGCDRG